MNGKKPIIAANWKMYKTPQEGYQFARKLKTRALNLTGVQFILFPSDTGIHHISEVLDGSLVELGGQNIHHAEEGAFTGESSVRMLLASGCDWVLIGHSERRHIFGETDQAINLKIKAALKAGLKIILCIGELLEHREAGRTSAVLRQQLSDGIGDLGDFPVGNLIMAYEPVWAIGTGVVATPEQAGEAHAEVRTVLHDIFPNTDVDSVPILYGGSVKTGNAADLIHTPGIDGFLIGGASLDIDEYCKIAEISQAEVS